MRVHAFRNFVLAGALLLPWGFVATGGCGSSNDDSSGSNATATAGAQSTGTGTGTGGAGGAGGAGQGGASTTGTAGGGTGAGGDCVPGGTQCTDCVDNDEDGWVDSWDVECIGPLDDDEGAFATGIPGDNVDPCKQDCFFDGNSGSGDDGCLWELACDPLNPGAPDCPYDPEKQNCPGPQPQQCIDVCQGLTPNGCDCFGCCEVTKTDGTTVIVSIGSDGCTEESLDDPSICKPCTQVQDCFNGCDTCEYCLGKTELPPECTVDGGAGGAGGGGGGCSEGLQECSPEVPCPGSTYCLTGCCIDIPS